MKILIAPGMLPGHALPFVDTARALVARGHEVQVYAEASAAALFTSTGAALIKWKTPDATARLLKVRSAAGRTDHYRKVTAAVAEDLLAVLERHRVGAALVDDMNIGAGLAARGAGCPWASFSTTPQTMLPTFREWLDSLAPPALCNALGLTPSRPVGVSPTVHLMPWIAPFAWAAPPTSGRLVGSPYRPSACSSELAEWLARAPKTHRKVVVALSTAADLCTRATIGRFLERLLAALSRLRMRAVLTVGDLAPRLKETSNVRIARFTDHDSLFDQAQLIVTHGGWGTITRASERGVPLLVVPFERDQSFNAQLCLRAGIGLSMHAEEATRDALAETLWFLSARQNPYARAARRLAPQWRRSGSLGPVVAAIEELSSGGGPRS